MRKFNGKNYSVFTLKVKSCSDEFMTNHPKYVKFAIRKITIKGFYRANDVVKSIAMYRSMVTSIDKSEYRILADIYPEKDSAFDPDHSKSFAMINKSRIYFTFTDKVNNPRVQIKTEAITFEFLEKNILTTNKIIRL